MFWGGVYEHVRGVEYNYNPNTTVLFNYVMSDTIAAQNMIKAIGFGSVAALLWHLISSLGAPIPFPQEPASPAKFPNIVRKPRAVDGYLLSENSSGRRKERLQSLILLITKIFPFSFNNTNYDVETDEIDQQRGLFYEEPYDDYFEDVFIVACNELFQPNGILRVFIINTLIMTSQYIFWIFCWVVLPPLP